MQRPIFEREPVFDLRINAAAEMGLTFAIDVVFFGVLQASLGLNYTGIILVIDLIFCLFFWPHRELLRRILDLVQRLRLVPMLKP